MIAWRSGCERAMELVVGLLAILEGGGAYVPLDPNVSDRAPSVHARGQPRPGRAERQRAATGPRDPVVVWTCRIEPRDRPRGPAHNPERCSG